MGIFDEPMNIIMNPPYNGNLHLKTLDKVIKANPNSEIVNLSPIRWLQDPFASDKKSTEFERFKNIRKHIADIEVISAKEANDLFSINLFSDLGIYRKTSQKNAESLAQHMNDSKIY